MNTSLDCLVCFLRQAMTASIQGSLEEFRRAADEAHTILFLADNAGEIVFDRLLIAQLGPERVTVAVRGGPVIASHVGFPVGTHVLTTPRIEALPTTTEQKGGA